MTDLGGRRQDEKAHSARYLILVFLVGVAACAVFFSLGFLVGYNERTSRSAGPTERVTPTGVIPPTVNGPLETVQTTGNETAPISAREAAPEPLRTESAAEPEPSASRPASPKPASNPPASTRTAPSRAASRPCATSRTRRRSSTNSSREGLRCLSSGRNIPGRRITFTVCSSGPLRHARKHRRFETEFPRKGSSRSSSTKLSDLKAEI
jgi:hypothetical protein